MIEASFYNSAAWRSVSRAAIRRDGRRCTVSRLLGGRCSPILHAHHIDRDANPRDLDLIATVCARHHPKWEALRRAIVERREASTPRCWHRHRTVEARRICEQRLARTRAA